MNQQEFMSAIYLFISEGQDIYIACPKHADIYVLKRKIIDTLGTPDRIPSVNKLVYKRKCITIIPIAQPYWERDLRGLNTPYDNTMGVIYVGYNNNDDVSKLEEVGFVVDDRPRALDIWKLAEIPVYTVLKALEYTGYSIEEAIDIVNKYYL